MSNTVILSHCTLILFVFRPPMRTSLQFNDDSCFIVKPLLLRFTNIKFCRINNDDITCFLYDFHICRIWALRIVQKIRKKFNQFNMPFVSMKTMTDEKKREKIKIKKEKQFNLLNYFSHRTSAVVCPHTFISSTTIPTNHQHNQTISHTNLIHIMKWNFDMCVKLTLFLCLPFCHLLFPSLAPVYCKQ